MNYGAWPTAAWGTNWGAVPVAWSGISPVGLGGLGVGGLGVGGFGGLGVGGLGGIPFGVGGYPATTFGSTFGVVPVTSVGVTPYPGVI